MHFCFGLLVGKLLIMMILTCFSIQLSQSNLTSLADFRELAKMRVPVGHKRIKEWGVDNRVGKII